jgi:hypothetical protein
MMISMHYDTNKILSQYEKYWGRFVPGTRESEGLFFETLVFNMGIPAQAAQEITKEAIALRK